MGLWKCPKTKRCVDETEVCDGVEHWEEFDEISCGDETNCENFTCFEGYVKCGDLKSCVKVSCTDIHHKQPAKSCSHSNFHLLCAIFRRKTFVMEHPPAQIGLMSCAMIPVFRQVSRADTP